VHVRPGTCDLKGVRAEQPLTLAKKWARDGMDIRKLEP